MNIIYWIDFFISSYCYMIQGKIPSKTILNNNDVDYENENSSDKEEEEESDSQKSYLKEKK